MVISCFWVTKFYALDGATGVKQWEYVTGQAVGSSPAIGADGTVYVGSSDSKLYALDGQTGAEKWRFVGTGNMDTVGNPTPVIGHHKILLCSHDVDTYIG